jgi:hypothetical protein
VSGLEYGFICDGGNNSERRDRFAFLSIPVKYMRSYVAKDEAGSHKPACKFIQ